MPDIFQEVEEDVRHERYAKLWKAYGNYVIAAAALLIIGVAGYEIWTAWDRSHREAASDQFHAAELLAEAGRYPEAERAFAKLAQDAPSGYATLASFHQAAAMLAEGKRDAAIAIFDKLAQLKDPALSGSARIRIAWAQAEYAPRTQIEKTLAPLTDPTSAWRFAAMEVLAYVDLRDGKRAAATDAYTKLAGQMQAPRGIKDRAGAIAQYLKANPQGAFITTPTAQEIHPQ